MSYNESIQNNRTQEIQHKAAVNNKFITNNTLQKRFGIEFETGIRTKITTLAIMVSCVMLTACATNSANTGNAAITVLTPDVVSATNLPEPIIMNSSIIGEDPLIIGEDPLIIGEDPLIIGDKVSSNNLLTLDEESRQKFSTLLAARDMVIVENDQDLINISGNLWNRVRQGYSIEKNDTFNARIETQKNGFITNQTFVNSITARASHYLYHMVREAESRGLPTELALLPIVESSYEPTKISNTGAAGLWQFMPEVGKGFGLTQTENYDGRKDIIASTTAAYDYLLELHNDFGQWELALAAYNSSPAVVKEAIYNNQEAGLPTDFWALKLPIETMNYVPRFLALSQVIAEPEKYGINLPAIADRQHFTPVAVRSGVSLNNVANVTNVPLEELKYLNPSLLSGRVESYAPQRVIVPTMVSVDKVARIKSLYGDSTDSSISQYNATDSLANVSTDSSLDKPTAKLETNTLTKSIPVTVETQNNQKSPSLINKKLSDKEAYVVQEGDTLEQIASDAGVRWQDIITWNQLDENGSLYIGTSLYLYDITKNQLPITKKAIKNPDYYIVRDGNTLSGTANKFGLTTQQIANYNGFDINHEMKVGDKISLIPNKNTKTPKKQSNTSSKADSKLLNKTSNKLSGKVGDKYYVSSGDGLLSVANKLKVTVQALASANGITVNDGLLIGQALKIPKTSSIGKSASKTAKPSNNSVKPSSKLSSDKKSGTYKVKSGDTLLGVANRQGVKAGDLATINNVPITSKLSIGDVLIIPSKSSNKSKSVVDKKSPVVSKKQAEPDNSTKSEGDKSGGISQANSSYSVIGYRIQSGDNLSTLAERYKVGLSTLARMNGLTSSSNLKAGQNIKVPVDFEAIELYTVRAGDSLTGIAVRYAISLPQLSGMNGLPADSQLKVGQEIKVPSR